MNPDKSDVTQKICQEIAVITNNDLKNINPEKSLRSNGIDSMSFLEILIFIKNEWGIDYLEVGLPSEVQNSISLLAEHICNNQGEK